MPPKLVASPGSSYSSISPEVIKELVFESSELTDDIQQLLDYQALQLLGSTVTDNDKHPQQKKQSTDFQKTFLDNESIYNSQRISTNAAIGQLDIHKIRKLLGKTMNRLRLTTNELAETLLREVEAQESFLSRIQRDVIRTSKLQEKVRKISQESEEALKLQKVLQREQDVKVSDYFCPSLVTEIFSHSIENVIMKQSLTNCF